LTAFSWKGDNVTGTAAVSFTEMKMTGGNDFNPVTIAGDADITIGSASITSNGISKRLQLDGTSANNVVTGVISNTSTAIAGAKVSLIKANSSTWHLQGNNTYTGDTTVSAGTLKLDFPCLDDASTVRINGTLELNHSDQDTVGRLFINGVEKAAGVYRSQDNPGEGTELPEITGNGTLRVLTDSYTAWSIQNITDIDPTANATPTGDPDGDGVTNLSEFAFKGNPLSGSNNGIVRVFTADGSADVDDIKELVLTIAVRKGGTSFSGSPLQLDVAGVTYTVQGSEDLSNFSAAVTEVAPVTTDLPDLSADPGYEYRSFSLDGSNGLIGKGFLRAKVAN
jgi:autotransporter-associated beta strand protein